MKNETKIIATLNIKRFFPRSTPYSYCELDYCKEPDGKGSLTLWHGSTPDNCEAAWEEELEHTKFKRKTFRIPGIDATFLLLSGKLYLRETELK